MTPDRLPESPWLRLIDALAELAVEDYLREEAELDSPGADARAERVPLPPMDEAA